MGLESGRVRADAGLIVMKPVSEQKFPPYTERILTLIGAKSIVSFQPTFGGKPVGSSYAIGVLLEDGRVWPVCRWEEMLRANLPPEIVSHATAYMTVVAEKVFPVVL
jgi:hypothetical protein